MPQKLSAGLLMYRQPAEAEEPEVFLVHPGGPFFAKKDKGWWSIPKGLPNEGEDLLIAAKREFVEETGLASSPPYLALGEIIQSGGKKVHAWAFEGDTPEGWKLQCNTFRVEWPPKSGKYQEFPEADQGRFFTLSEAAEYILPAQRPFLERLAAVIGTNP
jgi:predicted NUDIX family NTP pyrophosphohydrolase